MPPRPDNRTADVLDPGPPVTTFDPPIAGEDLGMSDTKGSARPGGTASRGSTSAGGETPGTKPPPDPAEPSPQIAEIAEKSQRLVADFLSRQNGEGGFGMANPMAVGAAFFEMTARMMSDPSRLVQAQLSFWNDYMTLWQRTAQRFLGGEAEPVIEAGAELVHPLGGRAGPHGFRDRKSTRLNSSHRTNSYAVFCMKTKTPVTRRTHR